VRFASAASRAAIPGRNTRTIGMISVFALLGGALPIVQLVAELVTDDRTPAALEVPGELNWIVLAIGAAAVTIGLTWDWLRIRYRPPVDESDDDDDTATLASASPARRRINWINVVNWVTVTVVSVVAGLAAYWLAKLVTDDVAPLLADAFAATAFIVVWANVVWWMPEAVRRLPMMDDRVDRAPSA
jgi:hypothetical protein